MKSVLDKIVWERPEPGCVLYLPGLPKSGDVFHDRSPYGNNGAISGATWTRLPSGLWVLSFDGTDDSINCGDVAPFQFEYTDAFTLMVWASTSDTGNWHMLLNKFRTDAPTGYFFRKTNGDKFSFQIYSDDSSKIGQNSTDNMLNDGKMHLWIGTYNGSGLPLGIVLYEDGVVKASSSSLDATITGGSIKYATALRIGADVDSAQDWSGNIGLVSVFNRMLAAGEINSIYQQVRLFGV